MEEVFVKCEQCEVEYVGNQYDVKEKKGQYGKYVVITYESHCTNCDQPIFKEVTKSTK